MTIVIIDNKKINTSAIGQGSDNTTLKYGDMVVYSGSYNGLVFGWFLGKSPSEKTVYILSSYGAVVSPYYNPVKFNWTSGINDLRIQDIDKLYSIIDSYRP